MKRVCEEKTVASNKRPGAATSVAVRDHHAATSVQAAWRGFYVRSSGLAACMRAQIKTSQTAATARRLGDVAFRLRTPEYRQAGIVPHRVAL